MSHSGSGFLSVLLVSIIASPQLASATSLKICDPGTFQNCHEADGAVPPKLIHFVDAKYPGEARGDRVTGVSVVELIVDEKGMPQNVTIVRSITERLPPREHEAGLKMDENAVKAVRKFRFKPATLNGQAVPCEITVEQNYHIY